MKILHLIKDHQVIERSLGMFEEIFPQQNEVLIFGPNNEYKHLDAHKDCSLVNKNNIESIIKNYDFTEVKYVICHYMELDMIDFILSIPKGIHVCWEIYGYDLYNQFLEPFGYKIYYTNRAKYLDWHPFLRTYFNELFNVALEIKGYKYKSRFQLKRLFSKLTQRINSVGVCCIGDLRVLERYSKRKFPYFIMSNYSLKETLGNLYDAAFTKGGKIMVANSASFSNNHLYVLKRFKERDNSFSKIIMPLSYGGTERYKQEVMDSYSKEFKNNSIEFILDYMPLHEYNKIFLDLNSMIMPAWRQESIGTIMMGFYLGIKVYMSERSPLYQSFVELGFSVYTIESDEFNRIDEPLSIENRMRNKELLCHYFDEGIVKGNIKNHFV